MTFQGGKDLTDTLDVGALELRRNKPLQLDIKRGLTLYSLRVTADNKLTVESEIVGSDYGLKRIEDLNQVRDFIAYALRRAICRGIDKAELVESDQVARIDFGVIK